MKGFVMMVISVALISLIVVFASSLHENYLSMERALARPQALSYAAFFSDDVAASVNALLGPDIHLSESSNSTTIIIGDAVPRQNFSSNLSRYESFLENVFANQTHTVVDANFSNMTNGRVKLFIDEKYTYENDPATKEMLFASSGGTGAAAYAINITAGSTRKNYSAPQFNSSGDLAVDIRYSDLNGSMSWSGKVSSGQISRMQINYTDGTALYLEIGRTHGDAGSLWMKSTGVTAPASVSWSAVLPPIDSNKKLGYEYDAYLSYKQGDVSLGRRIGR